MEQTKRQRQNTTDDNHNKKTKSTGDLERSSSKSLSHLEDLSNELIYEVFEFLDFCHTYDAFFDLNRRFQNLLTHSPLPMHINLSFVSKTAFERYYTNVIIPYQHRITSLHLSNLFIINHVFPLDIIPTIFTCLQKLTLTDFDTTLHAKVFIHLISFPHLHSLTINVIEDTRDRCNLYYDIFLLPRLKYCKVSSRQNISHETLPFATTAFSPIEYLVIDHSVHMKQVNILLSYLPQLRRLTLILLTEYSCMQTILSPIVLNHLTYVLVNLYYHSFDDLESMVKNLFHQVQVLYVTVNYDIEYLDGNRWERLILASMPYLRIFDLSVSCSIPSDVDFLRCIALIDQFKSLFWTERQWFFEYQTSKHACNNNIFLYSTNPYRRTHFTLSQNDDENMNENGKKGSMDSVNSVSIVHEKAIIQCENSFPNATALRISCKFSDEPNSFSSTYLNSFIPLRKLTKLVLTSYQIPFSLVIDLLLCMPNIYTLLMEPRNYNCKDLLSLEQCETFQLLSKTNNIKEVSIRTRNISKVSNCLIQLCSRLQHLTIDSFQGDWKEDFIFLLAKSHHHTLRLISVCFQNLNEEERTTLNSLIKSEELPVAIEQSTNNNIYLWW